MIKKNNLHRGIPSTSLIPTGYVSNNKPPKDTYESLAVRSGYSIRDGMARVLDFKTDGDTFAFPGAQLFPNTFGFSDADSLIEFGNQFSTTTVGTTNTLLNIDQEGLSSFSDGRAVASFEILRPVDLVGKTITIQDTTSGLTVFQPQTTSSYESCTFTVLDAISGTNTIIINDGTRYLYCHLSDAHTVVDGQTTSAQAQLVDIFDLGSSGGSNGSSDGDAIQLFIPTTAGGAGTVQYIKLVGSLTGSTPSHTCEVVRAASDDTTADRVRAAVNGSGDAAYDATKIAYGSSFTGGTTGIQGVTAVDGTSSEKISIKASTDGFDGNSIRIKDKVGTITGKSDYEWLEGGLKDALLIGLSGVSTNNGRAGRIRTALSNVNSYSNGITMNFAISGSTNEIILTRTNLGLNSGFYKSIADSDMTFSAVTPTNNFEYDTNKDKLAINIAHAINSNSLFRAYASKGIVYVSQEVQGTSGNDKTIISNSIGAIRIDGKFKGGATADTITFAELEGANAADLNGNSYPILDIIGGNTVKFAFNSSGKAFSYKRGYIYKGSLASKIIEGSTLKNFNMIKLLNEKVDRIIDWNDVSLSDDGTIEGTVIKSTGAPDGKVLTANGSNGATWATASGGGSGTVYHYSHHAWYNNSSSNYYLPFGPSVGENASTSDVYIDDTIFIAPFDGKLIKAFLYTDSDTGSTNMKLSVNGSLGSSLLSGGAVNCASDKTVYTFDCNQNNTFSEGDVVRVYLEPSNAPYWSTMTMKWELT